MKLFIDGEWNSYKGDLISLALVSECGKEFYESLGCENPDSWVAENVMPKLLNKPSITLGSLQEQLELYLSQFDAVHIIADWPEDVAWFCTVMVTGAGTRINTPPITFEILREDTISDDPHNALSDAHGLRKWYMEKQNATD